MLFGLLYFNYGFLQDHVLLQKSDQREPGYSLRCPLRERLYFSPS